MFSLNLHTENVNRTGRTLPSTRQSICMGKNKKSSVPSHGEDTNVSSALPVSFAELMHRHYDPDTADSLCEALTHTQPEVSVRLNPHKWAFGSLPLTPVPWCPDAYYMKERPPFTFDPLLHAGAYYVQEASSMYVSQILRTHCAEVQTEGRAVNVLDLCAAPGGKSTLLASLLPEGSTLLSNEPIPKRAQVLSENMQKWTHMPHGEYPVRSVVTNNYPDDFAAFTSAFDIVVTDVPCSGEGMFRKDTQAVAEWSVENVMMCAHRQREILSTIWHTLRDGGLLIYSTCTFNRFEDEDNAHWICDTLGGTLLEERHFLPGRDTGEGFYVAAIRKDGSESPSAKDITHLVGTLRVMTPSFTVTEGTPLVPLSYDEAVQYLRRETIRKEAPLGGVFLTYEGLVLGPGKSVAGRINNLYPTEWRIRSGYTQRFTLGEVASTAPSPCQEQ